MKRYINELNQEELKKVFENNEKLRNEVFERLYEVNMYNQEELYTIFFGKNTYDVGIVLQDYYNSFYLQLRDSIKFYKYITIDIFDYLVEEDKKKCLDLYKKAKKIVNNINKCNYGSDKYYLNLEKLDCIMVDILKILENELHKYEEIIEDDVFEYFKYEIEDNFLTDLYIDSSKNDFILYEDIAYTKNYA